MVFHKSNVKKLMVPMIFVTAISLCYKAFFYYWWGGSKSLGTATTSGLLYKPQTTDEDDCGVI
jgi:hypothetical protein